MFEILVQPPLRYFWEFYECRYLRQWLDLKHIRGGLVSVKRIRLCDWLHKLVENFQEVEAGNRSVSCWCDKVTICSYCNNWWLLVSYMLNSSMNIRYRPGKAVAVCYAVNSTLMMTLLS